MLAEVLRAKSDFGGAQAAYERAYGLNPNDADLRGGLRPPFISIWGGPTKRLPHRGAMRPNPLYPDWYLIAFCPWLVSSPATTQMAVDVVHRARQAERQACCGLLAAAHTMLDQREQADRGASRDDEAGAVVQDSETLRKALPYKDPASGRAHFRRHA